MGGSDVRSGAQRPRSRSPVMLGRSWAQRRKAREGSRQSRPRMRRRRGKGRRPEAGGRRSEGREDCSDGVSPATVACPFNDAGSESIHSAPCRSPHMRIRAFGSHRLQGIQDGSQGRLGTPTPARSRMLCRESERNPLWHSVHSPQRCWRRLRRRGGAPGRSGQSVHRRGMDESLCRQPVQGRRRVQTPAASYGLSRGSPFPNECGKDGRITLPVIQPSVYALLPSSFLSLRYSMILSISSSMVSLSVSMTSSASQGVS